ncbi:uncharacterized protein LOC126789911 [Argentina anserina]|uniref:uncharacterized protein LOC126789911 n=1 Tax=Argentina anserina TaxID=57926 RepID=UPI00217654A5|nr:uncharacterized protein LOC126789911 [Potentilla anserina]
MTLNRLLRLPKPPPPPPFHSLYNGIPKSTRWSSSSAITGAQKPPNSEDQGAPATVEESDNKCVGRHSGSFLDSINSWRTLKGFLTNISAKIGAPESQKQATVKMIASADNETASEVIKTKDSPQDAEIGQLNDSVPMPKVITDSQSCKQNFPTGLRSDVVGENSLSGQVAPNGKRVHGHRKDVEHDSKVSLQFLESLINSHSNEKWVTEAGASNIIRKKSYKNIGQSGDKTESHKQLELLSAFTHKLSGEASRIPQEDIGNAYTVIANGNPQPGKRTIFYQSPIPGSDEGKMPSSSSGPQQVQGSTDMSDMFRKTKNGKKANVITSKKSGTVANGVLDRSNKRNNETGQANTGHEYGINNLMGCIVDIGMLQNHTTPNNTSFVKEVRSVKKVRSHTNVQENDAKRKERSLRVHAIGKESVMDDLYEVLDASCQKEESTESKVLVRFLPKFVQESAISKAFDECGCITKIQLLPLIEGSIFRDAYVHFETKEGLHKALRKNGVAIEGIVVAVEATSLENVPNTIPIPSLIGDPEVPLVLVKNPTHTVMIKQLSHDISSHQLKEALSFCGSSISSIFLGSSSTVVYVEFETEDAKERAIAAYAINVQGKQLLIFRIDVPRTTVIRITSVDDTLFSTKMLVSKILSICGSYGEVGRSKLRSMGVLDVYFKLAEWPNMLSILNRLNGTAVYGQRLIAQPAPIFPPAILHVLWSKPDERIYVKSVLRRLLQNNELPVDLSDLATKYHGDKYLV